MMAPWPTSDHDHLVALVADGKTGREIAEAMGKTRSGVLGYCHRKGIKLPMTARKRDMMKRPKAYRPPRAGKTRRFRPGHPTFTKRAWGSRAFSDEKIAVAIAATLAGLSQRKAAALIGASAQSLSKHWLTNPVLMAAGRTLFEAARADAAERAAEARRLADLAEAAEAARIWAINEPILARMTPRHRLICKARIAGDTLQETGGAFGVTRERIRQIEVRWRMEGLIVPGARPLSEASQRLGAKKKRVRRPRRPRKTFWELASDAIEPGPKRTMNLSDAERQRRSEHMRRVATARWEARA